jgi:dolichyl-phosphate-mannose--protein O-mannosyl transferase
MGIALSAARVLYLYHYLIPLILSLINGFLLFLYFFKESLKRQKYEVYLIAFIVALVVFLCFVYFAPFTYHLPLSSEEFAARNWFEHWQLTSAN